MRKKRVLKKEKEICGMERRKITYSKKKIKS
jgi:hypothetical protein